MKNIIEYLQVAAVKNSDKTAVAYRDNKYSFSELNETAARYGCAIKELGIINEAVGVITERDAEPIARMMGVVYSDNFYVPIDPDMPVEKLQSIVDDAKISLILGPESFCDAIKKLNYEGEYLTACGKDVCTELPIAGDNDPLYMVYTSGSTGKPKGVLKSHGAVISYIEAFCETFDISEDDIMGNQTPFFFDASAKDLYLMLKKGITMEIIPTELFALPPELIDYLNDKKISYGSWVPTVLSIVAQLNPFSLVKPQYLKKLFFVGEVMPMKHLNKWREALPDIRYVNLYGQSEIAGICCYYEVEKEKAFDNAAVLPIGKPIENCRIYLMDNDTVISEAGKIGEMYIAGDTLALEYYNDPEKTHKSFVMKDFGEGSVRCFRTGDLAQYDEEGNLVFAARSDFQIKHMGHRIELGEIEAVAGALAEIDRCCCLYNAEKRKIVLFCELAEGEEKTGQEIKSLLKSALSSYMVPGKVTIVENLPLNANGKIDRQKLKTMV